MIPIVPRDVVPVDPNRAFAADPNLLYSASIDVGTAVATVDQAAFNAATARAVGMAASGSSDSGSSAGAGAGAGAGADPAEPAARPSHVARKAIVWFADHPDSNDHTLLSQQKFPTIVTVVQGKRGQWKFGDQLDRARAKNPEARVGLFTDFKMTLSPLRSEGDCFGTRRTADSTYESLEVESTAGDTFSVKLCDLMVFVLERFKHAVMATIHAHGLKNAILRNVCWMLTVPAFADEFMRKAAIQAGLFDTGDTFEGQTWTHKWTADKRAASLSNEDYRAATRSRLYFIREPVAAAVGSLSPAAAQQEVLETTGRWAPGDLILVIDGGGGTTDLAELRVESTYPLMVARTGQGIGAPFGAAAIDKDFRKAILELMPDTRSRKQFQQGPHLAHLTKLWTKLKDNYKGGSEVSIDLPLTLGKATRALMGERLPTLEADGIEIDEDSMTISGAKMQELFFRVMSRVAQTLKKEAKAARQRLPGEGPSFPYAAAVLVGGFGSSLLLQQHLTAKVNEMLDFEPTLGESPLISLADQFASQAICKGACILGVEKVLERRRLAAGFDARNPTDVLPATSGLPAPAPASGVLRFIQPFTIAAVVALRRPRFEARYGRARAVQACATRAMPAMVAERLGAETRTILAPCWSDAEHFVRREAGAASDAPLLPEHTVVQFLEVLVKKGEVVTGNTRLEPRTYTPLFLDDTTLSLTIVRLGRLPRDKPELPGDAAVLASVEFSYRSDDPELFKTKADRAVRAFYSFDADGEFTLEVESAKHRGVARARPRNPSIARHEAARFQGNTIINHPTLAGPVTALGFSLGRCTLDDCKAAWRELRDDDPAAASESAGDKASKAMATILRAAQDGTLVDVDELLWAEDVTATRRPGRSTR